ncbi:hypothetical protein C7389_102153 [Azoarcus indigens]|uniref:Uncharacterized protein n=1 Tax=Azoarcus indigens TaxID=29545 RepID=A0A4R6EFV8_9RHOO|nr:hypothetical protein C7389_102153 [Azoarcus indigens]
MKMVSPAGQQNIQSRFRPIHNRQQHRRRPQLVRNKFIPHRHIDAGKRKTLTKQLNVVSSLLGNLLVLTHLGIYLFPLGYRSPCSGNQCPLLHALRVLLAYPPRCAQDDAFRSLGPTEVDRPELPCPRRFPRLSIGAIGDVGEGIASNLDLVGLLPCHAEHRLSLTGLPISIEIHEDNPSPVPGRPSVACTLIHRGTYGDPSATANCFTSGVAQAADQSLSA